MFKGLLAFLGAGLFVLWVISAGLGVESWLMWAIGGLGILSLIGGATLPNRGSISLRVGVLGMVALALVGLWIAALVLSATTWLLWTTLAFAILYFMAAGSLAKARQSSAGKEIEQKKAA